MHDPHQLKDISNSSLYDRRLVFFSGKGGVGKTTIATAFALSCAQRGQKTLLMQLNAEDHIGALFGRPQIGKEIVELSPNLFAVNSTPVSAMREYALMTLKIKLIYKAVFENKIVKSFLRAIPGISEVLLLGKAYYHAAVEFDPKNPDKKKWDIVVIDAPATGHGIFLLKIPFVISSIISSGHMFDEAIRMQKLLQDPILCSINIVTLLEELPINESEMLLHTLQDELKIPVDNIIVNKILSDLFNDEEKTFLDEESLEDEILSSFLRAGRFRLSRVRLQKKYKKLLNEKISLPKIHVPHAFHPIENKDAVLQIAQQLESAIDSMETPNA